MSRSLVTVRGLMVMALLANAVWLLGGCAVTKQIGLRVVDLESGAPISGAAVRIEQGAGDVPYGPKTHETLSDDSGAASVGAEDQSFVAIRVSAPGYVAERFRISDPHNEGSAQSTCVDTVERTGHRAYEVRLLRGPEATVTLVVPDDFEGAIDLEYRATDGWEPGQRSFTVRVQDRRAALPAAPALDVAHRFEARRASGERIPGPIGSWDESQPRRSQVRLRGPIDGVRIPVYVIGDFERFERVMRQMYP